MAATKQDIENSKNQPPKKDTEAKKENKKNTMDIKLVDSTGRKIKMSGTCTDREIKAIGRAILHTPDQTVEVK